MTEQEDSRLTVDVEPAESWLISLSRDFGRAVRRAKNGIDLVADATESALNTTKTVAKKVARLSKRDRSLSSSQEALFQELGSKVAQCPGGDYSSLKNDVEFWELVKQIHSIRGKVGKKAVAEEEEEQREEAAGSSQESPGTTEETREVIPDDKDTPERTTAEEPKTAKPSTEE